MPNKKRSVRDAEWSRWRRVDQASVERGGDVGEGFVYLSVRRRRRLYCDTRSLIHRVLTCGREGSALCVRGLDGGRSEQGGESCQRWGHVRALSKEVTYS